MLAAIGGAGALLLGSVLSIGLGIVAISGIGSAVLVQRARRRRLTRVGSLAGSVLAVVVVLAGLGAFAVSRAPANFFEQIQQQAVEADRRPPPEFVRRMQRVLPPDPAAQVQTRALVQSRAYLWMIIAVTVVGIPVFIGVFVGAPAWGCMMLIGFGVRGRWPLAPPFEARR